MSGTTAKRVGTSGVERCREGRHLDELVAADHQLEDRAEREARSRLGDVDIDGVANAVLAALLALDQEDLAANAGRTRYGYVEPTEAAWSLLEAAVEPWLEDIERHEALFDRAEVRFLRGPPVAAGGSKLGAA